MCGENCFKIKILDPSGTTREVCMLQTKKSALNPNDLNIRLVTLNVLTYMHNTKQAIGLEGLVWKRTLESDLALGKQRLV